MRRQSEKELRNLVIRILEAKGFLVVWLANELMRKRFRNSIGLVKGLPDLLILGEGGFVCFVELKTEKGKLTEAQKVMIEELERRGFPVFVVRSLEEVENLVTLYGYEKGKK